MNLKLNTEYNLKKKSRSQIKLKTFTRGALSLGVLVMAFLALAEDAYSATRPIGKKKIKYRTNFGSCPSRSAGQMTLKLINFIFYL